MSFLATWCGIVHPERCFRDVKGLPFLPLVINSVSPRFKKTLLRHDLHTVKCTKGYRSMTFYTCIHFYGYHSDEESIYKSLIKFPSDPF